MAVNDFKQVFFEQVFKTRKVSQVISKAKFHRSLEPLVLCQESYTMRLFSFTPHFCLIKKINLFDRTKNCLR